MQQRSIGLCIFLSIITCGIYGLYWMARLTDESTTVTGHGSTSGGTAVLFSILTCGIYSIYWSYKMGEKLDNARTQHNVPTGSQAILYLVLSLFGLHIISLCLIQNELNKYNYAGDDF